MTLSSNFRTAGGSYVKPDGTIVWGAVPAKDVKDFHTSSDLDSGVLAQHHTLGEGAMQAAPGNHTHDSLLAGRLSTATQNIPNNTYTDIIWTADFEDKDLYDFASPTFSTITFKQPGWYEICAKTDYDPNAAGDRAIAVANGVNQLLAQTTFPTTISAGFTASIALSYPAYFNAGDVIKFKAFHNAGVALVIHRAGGTILFTYFWIKKIGG